MDMDGNKVVGTGGGSSSSKLVRNEAPLSGAPPAASSWLQEDAPPPPPPSEQLPSSYGREVLSIRNRQRKSKARSTSSSGKIKFPSSLDFERVINQYSIQATRDRFLEERKLDHNASFSRQSTFDDIIPLLGLQQASSSDQQQPLTDADYSRPADYSTFDEELNDVRKANDNAPPPPPPPSTPKEKYRIKRLDRFGHTGRSATRWMLAGLTGFLTGFFSILIVTCTETIGSWRSNMLDSLWQHSSFNSYHIFGLYAAINLTLSMTSAVLCVFVAPEGGGSGIPEIIAYLNGVRVKRFTSTKLFFVKIVGTILSVSSGLPLGPESPLVHTGAILGASCTKISSVIIGLFPDHSLFRMNERLWSFVTMDLAHFATDAERRDLVSIGSAAGFAAAFGAPIGGLLFSMEETSSYFDHSMLLKTLISTAIATFCLAVSHGDLSDYSVINLGSFKTADENIFLNRVAELPLYTLVAIGGGVLGGLFCRIWKWKQIFREKTFQTKSAKRIWGLSEVAMVSLLTSWLTYFVPLMPWTCRAVSLDDDLVGNDELVLYQFHAHQFDCPPGHINELADILFGSREEAISSILTDPKQFNPWTLFAVGLMFFPLMTFTLGTPLPTGIFMPTVLIGCSFGGAAGTVFQHWLGPHLSPSTFALLGAAALLAGIQRSTVSLCVILVEGTGQVKVLMPVIFTVVIARYVAELVHEHGLFETGIEVNRYPYLEHEENRAFDIFQVKDIMSAPPVTLGPCERATDLVRLLRRYNHHGFPVVDRTTNKFLGLIRRDQIVALLECGVFFDEMEGRSTDYVSDDGDDSDDDSSSFGFDSETETAPDLWTPSPGVHKSPMMNLAYHIKDDRYDHLVENDNQTTEVTVASRATKPATSSDTGMKRTLSWKTLASDDFDSFAWLVAVRQSLANMPSADSMSSLIGGVPSYGANSREPSMTKLASTLPPVTRKSSTLTNYETMNGGNGGGGSGGDHDAYAVVGTNRNGNVYVRWLNPQYKQKWINVAGVMNRGTFTVTEFCPVSRAHFLFTALGLRHLIVLGGDTGGSVVGIVTRINLLTHSIAERTGYEIEH